MGKALIPISLCFTLFTGLANADSNGALRCLAGLNSISISISKSRPDLSPRLARALYGNLMMAETDKGRSISPSDVPQGSPSDARICIGQDVNQAALTILLKAHFGYMPGDPYEEFSKCFTGFISVATEIEGTYGEKAGYEFGFVAGKKLGAQFTTMGYLFAISGPSGEEIQQTATKRLEKISNISEPEKARLIEEYLDVCEWYGVSIRSMYDGAVALDRT